MIFNFDQLQRQYESRTFREYSDSLDESETSDQEQECDPVTCSGYKWNCGVCKIRRDYVNN